MFVGDLYTLIGNCYLDSTLYFQVITIFATIKNRNNSMISVEGLTVEFGGFTLFDNVSFVVNKKDRIALVGKNGAGKSTMLKIFASLQSPTSGIVSVPKETSIGYLPQQMKLSDTQTVREEAELAFAHIHEMEQEIERLNLQFSELTEYESDSYQNLIDRVSHLTEHFQMMGGHNYHAELERTLIGLGFSRDDFDRPTSEFSGGWRMRIELAKLLLRKPDVLLLDEPTNHLDIESIQWLENFIATRANAVILVSHDRAFIDNTTSRTIEIELGKIYDYKVKYSDILIYDRLMCQEEWYRNLPEHIWNFIQISDDENYKLVSIGKGAIGLAGIHESKFSSLGVISGRLISMHFSSDGKYVKCISEKGEETIFNLLTKEQESAHLLEQIIFSSESIPSEISKDEAIEYFWSELNGVYKLKRINCSIDEDFHMNDPVEVRLSTQGRVCAIFAFPDEIALWDTYKENSYKKLQGHEGRVRFVDFSRDGKQLVSIGSDCKVNIWDAEQGKCLESIHEFDDRYSMSNTDYPLLFARFSEDGKCVLIVRNIDGIAIGYYVWDIEKRKYIYHNYKRGNIFNKNIYFGINNQVFCEELPIHIDPIFDTYCISPNNQLFAISIDNQLIIYNIADRKKLSIKKCNSRDIKYLSFSSDSRFVVSTGNSCISVWDIYEDGPVRVIEDKSMDFKEANLCTINNILYVRSNEYIHIWQHKPIQQMIDYLRGIFDV